MDALRFRSVGISSIARPEPWIEVTSRRAQRMLNRTAVIVRPKEPFIEWARSIDDDGTLPTAEGEQTVYLILDFDDDRGFQHVLKQVWAEIFERELEGWYVDETLWPQDRTLAMFKKWFSIEYHTVIEDLCAWPLEDDENAQFGA